MNSSLGLVGSLIGSVNRRLGPFLLRNALGLRYALGRTILRDNPTLDGVLLLHWAQRIVSSEVHHDSKQQQQQQSSDGTESEMRVRILEGYLRPVLLKNETWADVQKWRFHTRFLRWVRFEFLKAKYGPDLKRALLGCPPLRTLPQLASPKRPLLWSRDDSTATTTQAVFLPPTSMIQDAFDMGQWTSQKSNQALLKTMERTASKLGGSIYSARRGALVVVNAPMDADTKGMALEELLELVGGHVKFCGPFNALCEEANIYQLWTKEYVRGLAKYLLQRSNEFPGDTVIVDVGAGDGLLAKYLHKSMGEIVLKDASPRKDKSKTRAKRHIKVPTIAAVDDGSWKIAEKAVVLRLGIEEALAKYCTPDDDSSHPQQTIVLCSWMPMNVDWTHLFRKYQVHEYILIGECDDGTCGSNWETWGNPAFFADAIAEVYTEPSQTLSDDGDSGNGNGAEEPPAPYEIDGYQRIDMDSLTKYQFSRFDSSTSKTGRTVCFRAPKENNT